MRTWLQLICNWGRGARRRGSGRACPRRDRLPQQPSLAERVQRYESAGAPGAASRRLVKVSTEMDLDALLLSRLQFAFTIAFHIIFPSFTIGLASYLAVL